MKNNLDLAILSPNLTETIGGGEVYALKMGEILAEKYHVVIYSQKAKNKSGDMRELFSGYNIPPIPVRFIDSVSPENNIEKAADRQSIIKRLIREKITDDTILKKELANLKDEFDLFINCKYGRFPAPAGIKSMHILHFPAPPRSFVFPEPVDKEMALKYISSYDRFVANSHFSQGWFAKYWKKEADVLYPPIAMDTITPAECSQKENLIIAVGRLVPDKKFLEMAKTFAELKNENDLPYRFMIVGNRDCRCNAHYEALQQYAQANGIEICHDLTYDELTALYKRAKIFWHAKGYDVDDDNPFLMEHFGMTTVEAMANGCVPVVVGKAGQAEIVRHETDGLKWNTLDALKKETLRVIRDNGLYKNLQINAIERSKKYLVPAFRDRLFSLIDKLINR